MTDAPAAQGSPSDAQLAVIVPMFNEAATVAELLERLIAVPLRMQIVVVDDGSTDGSRDIVARFAQAHPAVELVCHEANRGKGAAVRTGIARARGAYTIIQDADLEYDPNDLVRLVEAAEREKASVVYGSRIRGGMPFSYRSFYWGGRLVSLVASVLYCQRITDEPTCYKLFKTELLQSLPLREEGFGFCAEATALVCRRGHRIVEVPIRYQPRSLEEGKKIRWTDGLRAIWILIRHRFGKRR
ncbi:MAG TPA: glycosyltransferase family 2 protein [Planctomycetota bacterium]|nr:glycosyltransferase family 2 protein [Planctomycetota bacterium]HRR78823.1 glycosyltransferase family 2 protein [Planctomycetota bacterium]HRT92870.1 glycosyltransferase family 2 protein [Planctomycetota bacterium]